MVYGFLRGYTNWVCQGEQPHYLEQVVNASEERTENDDMEGLLHDVFLTSSHHDAVNENTNGLGTNPESSQAERRQTENHFDENTEKFFKLLKNAEAELFPGCKNFTILSFIVRLLHVKSLCRWSNNSFTMLMEVLKEAFEHIEMFPSSYREAWKIIKELGLEYKKIHACPNDCQLYWKDTENDDACRHCKTPRYKPFGVQDECSTKREHKVPAKIVRYFPLKPRLQRLYMSSKTAHLMRWHAEERTRDGKLRHPADSKAWKSFDEKRGNHLMKSIPFCPSSQLHRRSPTPSHFCERELANLHRNHLLRPPLFLLHRESCSHLRCSFFIGINPAALLHTNSKARPIRGRSIFQFFSNMSFLICILI